MIACLRNHSSYVGDNPALNVRVEGTGNSLGLGRQRPGAVGITRLGNCGGQLGEHPALSEELVLAWARA